VNTPEARVGMHCLCHRRRNRWGRSGHGLTTFWAATIKRNRECGGLWRVTPTTKVRNRAIA